MVNVIKWVLLISFAILIIFGIFCGVRSIVRTIKQRKKRNSKVVQDVKSEVETKK